MPVFLCFYARLIFLPSLPRAERNRILSKASDAPWPSVPFAANPPARSMVLLPGAPLHRLALSPGRAWLAHWAHTTPRFPAYPRPGAPLHRLALSPGRAWLAHWAHTTPRFPAYPRPGAPLHLFPLSSGRAWLAHWAHTTPRFPAYPRPGAPLHLFPLSSGRAWLAHWAHTTPRFPAYPRPGAPLHLFPLSSGRAWLAHWAQNKKDRSAAICLFCLMVYVKRLAPQSGGLSLYGCIIPRLCGMGLSCL